MMYNNRKSTLMRKNILIQTMVYTEEQNTTQQLEKMGLCADDLRESVWEAYLETRNCTPNHPVPYEGMKMYSELVAALRNRLVLKGWEKEPGGCEKTINKDLKQAIIVSSGNSFTGIDSKTSSNKWPKGLSINGMVEINKQLELFNIENKPTQENIKTCKEDIKTWFLLYHRDKSEIRLELSCPYEIVERRTAEWIERIILSPISLDEKVADIFQHEEIEQPDIEVEVRRVRRCET